MLSIDDQTRESVLTAGRVQALRRQYYSIPLVLWAAAPLEDLFHVATLARRLHIRGLITDPDTSEWALRRMLTDRSGIGDEVVDWLSLRGLRLSPPLADLIRTIFTDARRHASLRGVLASAGIPERSARFRLHKRRLPSPHEWFGLAKALELALALQATPHVPLLQLAVDHGLDTYSAVDQRIRRNFLVTPSAVRSFIGWEWLLARWLDGRRALRDVTGAASVAADRD